jgi:hypothetical protein
MLQSGKPYDPVKLTTELNVNRRTVYRDIALLREMGIDIAFDASFGGYVIRRTQARSVGKDKPQQLQQALDRALSDQEAESSIEELIRQVALILAGAADETGVGEGRSHSTGGHRANEQAVGALGESEVAGSEIAGSEVRDRDLPTEQRDADGVRVDHGQRRQDFSEPETDAHGARLPSAESSRSAWCGATDALLMLHRAVQQGQLIEISAENPRDAVKATAVRYRVRPIEFIVRSDGIVISGRNSEGRLIESRVKSVRQVVPDEKAVPGSHLSHSHETRR